MISTLLSLLLSASSCIISVSAQEDSVPPNVALSSIAYGGTGCPQGSLDIVLPQQDNSTIFYVDFTNFDTSVGPGIPITQTRKNCQINLNFNYPTTYQYAPRDTIFEGYANIPRGINASIKSSFYFSGGEEQSSSSFSLAGPRSEEFEIDDVVVNAAYPSLVWSPCYTNLPLNINTQVRLLQTNYNASGTGVVSGLRLAVVSLWWRKCPV